MFFSPYDVRRVLHPDKAAAGKWRGWRSRLLGPLRWHGRRWEWFRWYRVKKYQLFLKYNIAAVRELFLQNNSVTFVCNDQMRKFCKLFFRYSVIKAPKDIGSPLIYLSQSVTSRSPKFIAVSSLDKNMIFGKPNSLKLLLLADISKYTPDFNISRFTTGG